MSNLLAAALDKPAITIGKTVAELEHLSGYPSEDSRLISEVVHAAGWQVSQLGLDPLDTTANELYQTLLSEYERTSRVVATAIGESGGESLQLRYARVDRIIAQFGEDGEVWALKNNAICRLLKAQPPKRAMKQLGYRSLASMLKRQDSRLVFTAANVLESNRWQKLASKFIEALDSSDFEVRQPWCVVLPEKLWSGSSTRRPLAYAQPEVGVVAIWPNQLSAKTTSLGVLTLCLKQLEQLHNLSAGLDGHYLSPELGRLAKRLWNKPTSPAFTIGSLGFSWCSLGNPNLSITAELSSGRLPAIGCRQQIGRLHPALRWWAANDYLLFVDGKDRAVSLNIVDVAISHAASLSFSNRLLSTAQLKLTDELGRRYLQHDGVARVVSGQLAGGTRPNQRRHPGPSSNPQLVGAV